MNDQPDHDTTVADNAQPVFRGQLWDRMASVHHTVPRMVRSAPTPGYSMMLGRRHPSHCENEHLGLG